MEDLMFSLFLFVLIYSFLYRLTFGSKQHSSVNDDAWFMNESGEIVVQNDSGEVETIKPIEQQLKDIWGEIDEVVEPVEKVQEKPTIEELLEGIEIKDITLRKARKIASVLKIKQTVNRKSQSKALLLKQIEKKLKANPIEVAPIIVEKVNAA